MGKDVKPEMPKVELATQEWVRLEMMTINNNIEKGFHEVEKNLQEMEKNMLSIKAEVKEEVSLAMTSLTRWMFGLMITTAFVIVAAVIAQSF